MIRVLIYSSSESPSRLKGIETDFLAGEKDGETDVIERSESPSRLKGIETLFLCHLDFPPDILSSESPSRLKGIETRLFDMIRPYLITKFGKSFPFEGN